MNDVANIIKMSIKDCLEDQVDFLEHVKRLTAIHVKNYEVDLENMKIVYEFSSQLTHQEELPISTPFLAKQFDQQKLMQAIMNVQKKKITYPTFLEHIAAAGVNQYRVFIEEAKVIYYGDNRSVTEHFPKVVE
ncbi:DUF1398 family protein [Legionella cardiaca]|uniref:DUF1398 family protein n=1 Tax=Legionella cardiaca TaxID=1071983 RepID=A0ABY8AVV1_9GAMM|nr:DUF1398 family protein [Legionella cardiaca]WED43846.1 DUF1398 family protein [Legionella cardiaca]